MSIPIKVGTTCKVKSAMLNTMPGTKGVCYDVSSVGDRPSYGFIFEDGFYDGFSPDDLELFLELCGEADLEYEFRNVMLLSSDFDNGKFKEALSWS